MTSQTDVEKRLVAWRRSAQMLRQELDLDTTFENVVKSRFERTIVSQYWKPVYKHVMNEVDQSDRRWAEAIGIARGTVNRWDGELVGNGHRPGRMPTLSHYVTSLAAFRVDYGKLPDGARATIEAYRATFDFIEQDVLKRRAKPILPDEVLCLHYVMRSDWPDASAKGDSRALISVSEDIVQHISRHLPNSTINGVERIQCVLTDRADSWLLLESVIPHEWF